MFKFAVCRYALWLGIFFLSTFTTVPAQIVINNRLDSIYGINTKPFVTVKPKPRPWMAAAKVAALNLGINLFDRYALRADYARVTGENIKNNLKHQFLWDNDNFDTNLFWHPYTGGLYFNAARANGLRFWQSVPFAFGGSYLWEIFCETQPPSLNDIVATPVGGIVMGEISHRVSHLILDDSKRGWERFGHELLAGIISPMDLLNRLLRGDAWRYRPRIYEYEPLNTHPLFHINVSVFERFMADLNENRNNLNWAFGIKVIYGQPFTEEERMPYDFFAGEIDVNIIGNQPFLSNASVIGLLWGKEWQKDRCNWLAGIFQHYDYYNSNPVVKDGKIPYEFAETASFGGGLQFKAQMNKKSPTLFYGSLHINHILLGASEADYLYIDKRNYNMGNGYSIKSSVAFSKKRWNMAWGFKLYHIFTIRGYGSEDIEINGLPANANADYINAQGNKGNTLLGMTYFITGFRLSSRISLSAEQRFYFRNSHYTYLEGIETQSTENRIKITYTLFNTERN
jgi:hypothetical protein